jgi:hypothetical protein
MNVQTNLNLKMHYLDTICKYSNLKGFFVFQPSGVFDLDSSDINDSKRPELMKNNQSPIASSNALLTS